LRSYNRSSVSGTWIDLTYWGEERRVEKWVRGGRRGRENISIFHAANYNPRW